MYLSSLPTLAENSKKALRVIQKEGVVSGYQLMSETGISANDIVPGVAELVRYGLISTSGSVSNPNDIGDAYFNIRPSGRDLTDVVLNTQQ